MKPPQKNGKQCTLLSKCETGITISSTNCAQIVRFFSTIISEILYKLILVIVRIFGGILNRAAGFLSRNSYIETRKDGSFSNPNGLTRAGERQISHTTKPSIF